MRLHARNVPWLSISSPILAADSIRTPGGVVWSIRALQLLFYLSAFTPLL